MSTERKVAVLVGSLRKASWNRKVAQVLIELAPPALKPELIELGTLPLYNEDLEAEPPSAWLALRQQISASDALLFVTPEYNRSMPGVLKNALDVGSRPSGKSVWRSKPAAIVTASPGALGGFGCNHHLRQSLVSLNVPSMQQPEIYLGGVNKAFDEAGKLNDGTRALLEKFMTAFAAWIEQLQPR